MSNKKFSEMKEGVTLVVASVMVFFGILFWNDIKGVFSGSDGDGKEKIKNEKKGKKKDNADETGNTSANNGSGSNVTIIERWDLPDELLEVSGIAYLANENFACVQDEKGTVYIYNSSAGKLEKEIPFAGAGDYEGITIVGQAIYVIRADGKLFMVEDMNATRPVVKEYETGLTIKNNIESLCYDKAGNRLLMVGKDKDPEGPDQKRIFGFDIQTKKLNSSPLYTIDLNHHLLLQEKSTLRPSAIGIHPVSSEIYIVDGPAANLLLLDPEGSVKDVYKLDSKQFPQAEGISFGETGEVYISTEGVKGRGAIIKVSLSKS